MPKSFFEIYGRYPVPGIDYNPDEPMCKDDHDFFFGEGIYNKAVPQWIEVRILNNEGTYETYYAYAMPWKIDEMREHGKYVNIVDRPFWVSATVTPIPLGFGYLDNPNK